MRWEENGKRSERDWVPFDPKSPPIAKGAKGGAPSSSVDKFNREATFGQTSEDRAAPGGDGVSDAGGVGEA